MPGKNIFASALLLLFVQARMSGQIQVSGQPSPELSSLDSTMTQVMTQWNVPGAALAVTYNGRLVFAHGYGYANTGSRQPVQPDSLFRVASLSKPFTAAAILKLIEAGRLQLNTRPFATLLSDLTPPAGQTKDPRLDTITVQNILDHKGGWDDTVPGVPDPAVAYVDLAAQALGLPPPADPSTLTRYMLGQPLQHDPGSTFAYSNFGYIVLGLIVERLSGDYGTYVKNNIQAPAGIVRMQLGKTVAGARLPGEVSYYDFPGAPQVPSVVQPLYSLVPVPYGGFSLELLAAAGGWVASTIDLLKFLDTMNGQLTPSILQSPPAGFVLYVPPVGNRWVWLFNGDFPGTNARLHLDNNIQLNGKVSWAVLFNTRSGTSTLQPQTDADSKITAALQAIQTWPSVDLFSSYSGSQSSCALGVSSSSIQVVAASTQAAITVSDSNDCGWTATSNASWIAITSGTSGSDSGTVALSILPNPSSNARTGTVSIAGQTVVVTQQAVPGPLSAGLRFVPMTPCRVVDTRPSEGSIGGPTLSAATPQTFSIAGGRCGVPANAAAYSLNATVVPKGSLQYLTLWPTGKPQPLVSTLNSYDGRVKANAAIVPAGTAGSVTAFVTESTDLILDVSGYFVSPSDQSALTFFPLAPCRVVDTRSLPGQLGGPALTAGIARTLPLLSTACGLSSQAQAYALNITVIPRAPVSYVTAWPAGQAMPIASVLNAPSGTVTANAAVLPAGQAGAISIFSTGDADLVIDVNGYFGSPAGGGLGLYTLLPCRALDSRSTTPPSPILGAVSAPLVPSACGVSPSSAAVLLNATVVPAGSLSYLTLWADGQAQPLASTLNAYDSSITSNLAIVPSTAGSIDAFASSTTQLILDVSGYFAP